MQIDDTPSAIGRFNKVDVGVLGDAAVTLRLILERLADAERRRPAHRRRRAMGDLARREGTPGRRRPRAGVASAAVFAALGRHCPADAVIAVDVGNHAYSFGRYFESAGQPVLMSGYLGSIGFGYPAAMGAWAADPSRPVVAVTGDGGFGQYLAEVTTAVKYGIPVKHVLLDNGALGKISKEQLAGGLPGLADVAGQPRLRRVRPALRGDRHLGRPQRRHSTPRWRRCSRRRPGDAARPRRRPAGLTCPPGW